LLPLQSAKPEVQAPAHWPEVHAVPEFEMWFIEHWTPQPPQLSASERIPVSQPLTTEPSQLAKPELQTMLQLPPVHEPVPLVKEQELPQEPQLA
jgi:hypothetical protein